MTLSTLIAEDEPLAREGLADWVHATPGLDLVASASDGLQALEAVRRLRPGLLLLDIQMPGLTGLQLLQTLGRECRPAELPAVVFTTAFDAHALAAFELHAVDYLLKPFERARFDEAITHVLARQGAGGEAGLAAAQAVSSPMAEPLSRLWVREAGRLLPLNVAQIEYLHADTKYTAVTSAGKTFLVRLPITHFEQRLDAQRFLKLNRSCIVNLDFVEALAPDDNSQLVARLRDGSRFTASREVSKALRAQSL